MDWERRSSRMLEFENSETVNINMTHLKGTIKTTYDKLVKTFGEPTFTDASPYEKVNAQWCLDIKVPFEDEYGEDEEEAYSTGPDSDIIFDGLAGTGGRL